MSPTENLVDMNDALAKSAIFFFLKRKKKTWDEHIFYQNLYVQSRTCWRLLNLRKKEFLQWNEREKRKRSITISLYKVKRKKKLMCKLIAAGFRNEKCPSLFITRSNVAMHKYQWLHQQQETNFNLIFYACVHRANVWRWQFYDKMSFDNIL